MKLDNKDIEGTNFSRFSGFLTSVIFLLFLASLGSFLLFKVFDAFWLNKVKPEIAKPVPEQNKKKRRLGLAPPLESDGRSASLRQIQQRYLKNMSMRNGAKNPGLEIKKVDFQFVLTPKYETSGYPEYETDRSNVWLELVIHLDAKEALDNVPINCLALVEDCQSKSKQVILFYEGNLRCLTEGENCLRLYIAPSILDRYSLPIACKVVVDYKSCLTVVQIPDKDVVWADDLPVKNLLFDRNQTPFMSIDFSAERKVKYHLINAKSQDSLQHWYKTQDK